MIGILLVSISALMDEVSSSIGKWEVANNKESLYTYGFLNCFWIWVMLIVTAVYRDTFVFSLEALPLFLLAVVLEIAQVYASLHSVAYSDRSTTGFLSIITLPLLLAVDYFFDYQISVTALWGIAVIVCGLIFLLINHGLSKKGVGYVIFSSLNAVATISLYKYLITHYNSVEGQQIVMYTCILVFLFIMARLTAKQNPLRYLFKKEFMAQSIPRGVGGVLISFAYLFASPAVITSGKRATAVLLAVVSGKAYFHEKHFLIKLVSAVLVMVGIVLLAL